MDFLCAARPSTIAAATRSKTVTACGPCWTRWRTIVRDLEQISRNSYLLVGVIEIFRRRDVYLITTECDLNTELINCGLERFAGDRFTRASFGKPRFDVRLPLMDQF